MSADEDDFSRGSIDFTSECKTLLKARVDRAKLTSTSGTLKVQTQVCILKNLLFFYKVIKLRPGSTPFARVSNPMKKELIDLFAKIQSNEKTSVDSFEVQSLVLGLLLNPDITTFHFPQELMRIENQSAGMELCEKLVALRPLALHTVVATSPFGPLEDDWNTKSLTNILVDAFPNIEVLRMQGCVWADDDLRNVADRLPQLRILEVYVSGHPERLTEQGFAALSKLQSLQVFSFYQSPFLSNHRLSQLLKMCCDYLPQLHAVSMDPAAGCKNLLRKLGESTGNALADFGIRKRTLNLRRLVVSGRVPYVSFHFQMPELSELFLCDVSRYYMFEFLQPNLTVLHVDTPSCVVELDSLLQNCPQLSELSLHVAGFTATPTLQPNTLQHLRILQVSFADFHVAHSPELLVEVVRSAPELRSVSITFQFLYDGLFEELALLSTQPSCMRHLEELKFFVETIFDIDTFEYDPDAIKVAIDTCLRECDQLKILQFEIITNFVREIQ